ncbi:hypothetical protein Tco_1124646 [Tanacetum coccineum]|uniref:Uncharacterized protein n=1 Tax=Tanacetum coccineum TaxID=301880 RepID=A0ABQ5J6Q4_9ASTR
MQRPPLLEPNGFFFWKTRFETYIKSKDIDLWKVIQNGDFYFEIEDSETNMMKETPYELLKVYQKRKLGKTPKSKMISVQTPYRVKSTMCLMCKTAKEYSKHPSLLTHWAIHKLRIARLIFSRKNMRSFQSPMKKYRTVAGGGDYVLLTSVKIYKLQVS